MSKQSHKDRQSAPRLLCIFGGESDDERPPFARELEAQGWIVDCAMIRGRTAKRILKTFRVRDIGTYDVVATNEYFLAWAACLRLLASPHRPKLVVLTFNQSSAQARENGTAANRLAAPIGCGGARKHSSCIPGLKRASSPSCMTYPKTVSYSRTGAMTCRPMIRQRPSFRPRPT